tara:strand:+ start:2040 stop:2294 length:255 start_codon:yes stop_codon:yes gene_type:complete
MSTDQKSVYELNLHEETTIRTGKKVMRVPGGWIYTTIHSLDEGMNTISQSIATTFVPEPLEEISKDGKTIISKPKSPKGLNFGS